jgi:hypothetical protein
MEEAPQEKSRFCLMILASLLAFHDVTGIFPCKVFESKMTGDAELV